MKNTEKTVRSLLIGALALSACAFAGGSALTDSAEAEAGPGWKLKWSDEFDGTELDTNVWQRCKTGGSDWNRHMSTRPDLVFVRDGHVTMRGVKNDGADKDKHPWVTGGIENRFGPAISQMAHGKVLIRVKFQDHQKGAWPALWMCGVNKDAQGRRWPWNGEIDIVERLNGDAFVYQTVHSGWTFHKTPSSTRPSTRAGRSTKTTRKTPSTTARRRSSTATGTCTAWRSRPRSSSGR